MRVKKRKKWKGITCYDDASCRQVKQISWKKRMIATLAATLVVGVLAGYAATSQVNHTVYTVGTGDTLWSIAEQFAYNDDDLREAYWRIVEDNNLSKDGIIQPGQQLVIYRY
ncbi:LysM peptidoglycan-binding domain-containing protein [uncultured Megasphaera sp.]|jgi:LysM repeat protein|uniref:LysM peptidoglycan-binding domain-containing protein n=1 Tax=uncultured Megasphaera sp. TaxID=165188 RepID=UPI002631DAB6|nr:LysM domain-containing protein [uncultured Megasphaera sp.]